MNDHTGIFYMQEIAFNNKIFQHAKEAALSPLLCSYPRKNYGRSMSDAFAQALSLKVFAPTAFSE